MARLDDNSEVYLHIPLPNTPNALTVANQHGYEVQIDDRRLRLGDEHDGECDSTNGREV